MGKWFPHLYDAAMRPLEKIRFSKIRIELVGKAKGRVLEIGSGTGVNFAYYQNASSVDVVEPNVLMSNESVKHIEKSAIPIKVHSVSAEELPFDDCTFDSVVSTLVFCSIPNNVQALQEIRRVSKKGAQLLFFEHVRMEQNVLGKTQDLLTPLWEKAFDGCHLNRNTLELIKQSGLEITNVESNYGGLFLTIECLN